MARVMAIDVGKKRFGLAVTDPLGMIAVGLDTVVAKEIWNFMQTYLAKEEVKMLVVGYPRQMNNLPSEAARYVDAFLIKCRQKFPHIPVELMDERFTSKIAHQSMIEGGVKKKDRQNKELADKISAVLILQSWLEKEKIKKNR